MVEIKYNVLIGKRIVAKEITNKKRERIGQKYFID